MAGVLHIPQISKSHLHESTAKLVGLVLLAAVLQVLAGVGMAYVAGFHRIATILAAVRWPWLVAVAGALGLAGRRSRVRRRPRGTRPRGLLSKSGAAG